MVETHRSPSSVKPPESSATAENRPTSLGYHPALDGLRGLALIAIIVYHSGLDWAPGAFLSVSTFFTLSGFLITALLLAEHERYGAISLRSFWNRRLRRLMPAAIASIVLIVVAAIWLADSTQLVRLRADALSALGYVANWRFIVAGDSYGASFASPSPFTHFWTLAIEEQFYVALPLIVVAALAFGRGSRKVVAGVLGGVAAASILWANILVSIDASIDRLYFGTDIRAAELLAGSLLAVWWMRSSTPLGDRGVSAVKIAGPLSVVAMIALWVTADLNDTLFYRGGLAVYSLLTLIAIMASLQPDGLVRRVLGWRPIAWVGVVSYGAYLAHYPILLWLRRLDGVGQVWRLVIAVPLTFAVAELSARFLERPIRDGTWIPNNRIGRVVLVNLAGGVAAVLLATTVIRPPERSDFDAAEEWQRFVEATSAQQSSVAPRIALYGDSTALITGRGLSEVSRSEPDEFVAQAGWANLGCGLIDRGTRIVGAQELAVPELCNDWPSSWRAASAENPADIAVVQLGPWEVHDQRPDPNGELEVIGSNPGFDDLLKQRLRLGIDALAENNVMVVFVLAPDIEMGRIDGRSPEEPHVESDPARMERVRRIIAEVAAEEPAVRLVDLRSWVAAQPDDATLRPDGVHFSEAGAQEAARWLGPKLVSLYAEAEGTTESRVRPS